MSFAVLLALLSPPHVFGHFMLSYPPSLSNSLPAPDSSIGVAPCGLNTTSPFFNNLTSPTTTLSISSFPLYISTAEEHQWWLFRATTDKVQPFRWTNLLPVVEQSAEGSFCLQDLSLPKSFAGRDAVLQVVQQHDGGFGYQCATVGFVANTPETLTPPCQNATGLNAVITDGDDLPSLHNDSTDSSSNASATDPMDMGNMTPTSTKGPHNHSMPDDSGTKETAKSVGQRTLASAGLTGGIALFFWFSM